MKYSTCTIRETLEKYPKAGLTIEPTPIHRLPRLSARFRRNIYIMRDDLTGFGIGGNKVRKLDYLIGDALAKKADTLVTTVASSFSRNAAFAGRAFGFEVHVILTGTEAEQNPASQTLFKRTDTKLHYVLQPGPEALQETLDHLLGELEGEGKSIYPLHPGGSDAIGCLGYVNAFEQIALYAQEAGVRFSRIIHATGSTATQAGLVLGQCLSGYDTTIIGMAASQKADIQRRRVLKLALETAAMLRLGLDESLIVVDDRFLGPGYARASQEGDEAARLFAQLEGVLLDDAYTAKAAAGLIHGCIHGEIGQEENALFVHTSGDAGVYY